MTNHQTPISRGPITVSSNHVPSSQSVDEFKTLSVTKASRNAHGSELETIMESHHSSATSKAAQDNEFDHNYSNQKNEERKQDEN